MSMNALLRISIVSAMLSFGFAASASAREIYVATDGSDDHAGTIEAPLHSLPKALGAASAGDVIRLRKGEYRPGVVTLKTGGTEGKSLVIEAAQGEEVVLK